MSERKSKIRPEDKVPLPDDASWAEITDRRERILEAVLGPDRRKIDTAKATRAEPRVYAIQAGKDGPIKLGWAARPKARLNELQVGNPAKLILLRQTPGGEEYEASIHKRFAHLRLRGEWFSPAPELLAEIKGWAPCTSPPTTYNGTGEICSVCRTKLVKREDGMCRACKQHRDNPGLWANG